MDIEPFFKNFGSIILYAVPGTLIALIITSSIIFFGGFIGLANVINIYIIYIVSTI